MKTRMWQSRLLFVCSCTTSETSPSLFTTSISSIRSTRQAMPAVMLSNFLPETVPRACTLYGIRSSTSTIRAFRGLSTLRVAPHGPTSSPSTRKRGLTIPSTLPNTRQLTLRRGLHREETSLCQFTMVLCLIQATLLSLPPLLTKRPMCRCGSQSLKDR